MRQLTVVYQQGLICTSTYSGQSVFGLKFLSMVNRVIDQSKSRSLATSEVSSKSITEDSVWGGLVHAS